MADLTPQQKNCFALICCSQEARQAMMEEMVAEMASGAEDGKASTLSRKACAAISAGILRKFDPYLTLGIVEAEKTRALLDLQEKRGAAS